MKKPHLRWEGGAYRWEMLSVHNRSVRVATNGTTISARIGEVESSMGSTAAVGVVGRSVGLLRSGIPAAGVAVATTIRGIAAIVGLGLSLSRRLCLGFSLRLGCCLGVGILLRSLGVVHLFDGGVELALLVGVGLRVGHVLLVEDGVRLVDRLPEAIAGGVVSHLPVGVLERLVRAVNTLPELRLGGFSFADIVTPLPLFLPSGGADYYVHPNSSYIDPRAQQMQQRDLAVPAGVRYLRMPVEGEGRIHGAVRPRAFVMPSPDSDLDGPGGGLGSPLLREDPF